jgi:hypothetical protein
MNSQFSLEVLRYKYEKWIKRFVILFLLFSSFSFTSCNQSVSVKSKQVGFYYWQTTLNLTSEKIEYLNQTNSKRLYVRLFDIDTSKDSFGNIQVSPVSILRNESLWPDSIEFVPVVYFTRQAIKSSGNLDTFSYKIEKLVNQLMLLNGWHFNEIQWDYDWTPSTKQTYFDLLVKLKQRNLFKTKIFSSTIRLHQVKHRSLSGIPPVDKGLMMCYNMGNLKSYGISNSILDMDLIEDYLSTMETYPLKLDVAFPLFHWGVQFRNQKFTAILNDISATDLLNSSTFTEVKPNVFKAKQTDQLKGFLIEGNDEIRIEDIAMQDLKKAVSFVGLHNNNDSLHLLFFHLNETVLKKYPTYELQEIIDAY